MTITVEQPIYDAIVAEQGFDPQSVEKRTHEDFMRATKHDEYLSRVEQIMAVVDTEPAPKAKPVKQAAKATAKVPVKKPR